MRKGCLTFRSPSEFTVEIDEDIPENLNIEISYDGKRWQGIKAGAKYTIIRGARFYMRGTGNKIIRRVFAIEGTDVSCEGNIETLMDYATVPKGKHPPMKAGCFFGTFAKCTGMVKAPDLPAVKLISKCYYGMFYNCVSLVSAPALPAKTLKRECYAYMFYGCKFLERAPVISAEELAPCCYEYMYFGCTQLETDTHIPE